MNIDIENNIYKICQYFSILTVRTERLKAYCDLQIVNTRNFSLIARLAGSPYFLEFQDC